MRYSGKWMQYRDAWDAMVIKPLFVNDVRASAQFAVNHKPRYLDIAAKTGMLWAHVAVLHHRESDSNFHTYLGNGDPLDRMTCHVPKHRGPFATFEAGAIDALRLDGLDDVKDWRIEKVLYYCELFNGCGYDRLGLPSPYLWACTNAQHRGKYVSDGHFDQSVMDTQPGCAPLLWMIAQLDPTVVYAREVE